MTSSGIIVAMLYDVVLVWFCIFFFQAEDGIRDLVRSRGLGDVYKRQSQAGGMSALDAAAAAAQKQMANMPATDIRFCGVDDPTCESCQ
mgnify:CR=1 FL=1